MKKLYLVGYRDKFNWMDNAMTEFLQFESQEEALEYAKEFTEKNIEIVAELAELPDE